MGTFLVQDAFSILREDRYPEMSIKTIVYLVPYDRNRGFRKLSREREREREFLKLKTNVESSVERSESINCSESDVAITCDLHVISPVGGSSFEPLSIPIKYTYE